MTAETNDPTPETMDDIAADSPPEPESVESLKAQLNELRRRTVRSELRRALEDSTIDADALLEAIDPDVFCDSSGELVPELVHGWARHVAPRQGSGFAHGIRDEPPRTPEDQMVRDLKDALGMS